MKRIVSIVSFIILFACLFASCSGPITEEQLFDGKTPKALYGESVNKYKNHKDQGTPYSVNVLLTGSDSAAESVSIGLAYDGDSFKYVVTEATEEGSFTEEILYHGGKMYFKDKNGGKHSYSTSRKHTENYVNQSTKVKDVIPAFPDNIPESWLDDIQFVPSEDGEYYIAVVEGGKASNHPQYDNFYNSDVVCKLYFTKGGILDKISLENVKINGESCNVVITISWQLKGNIVAPDDKNDYQDKGDFDFDKGHKPGDDNRPPKDEHQHTAGDPVIENETAATCTADGSYDEVVYCADESCKAEISRTAKTIKSEGHNFENGKCTKCDEPDPDHVDPTPTYSEGLEFTLINGNTEYSVTGIGTCTDTDIVFPDTYNNLPVTSIGDDAFINCTNITSVEIPDSVTSIGDYSFFSCYKLTRITIPSSIIYIGDKAFFDCYNIMYNEYENAYYLGNENNPYVALISLISEDVTYCDIPESTKVVCKSAFYYGTSLTHITVNENNLYYKSINGNLYTSDCKTLIRYAVGKTDISFNVPDGITNIENNAFYGATVKNILIPDSVAEIGDSAFLNCNRLNYNEYDNAYYLGNENNPYVILVKSKSMDIASCNINEKTKIIYYNAFHWCFELTGVVIPDGVTSIGSSAFEHCDILTSVKFGDNSQLTSIGSSVFSDCDNLTSVIIPNGVTSIGSYAFSDCDNLTSVIIPNGVTSIGSSAFYSCDNLTSVVIGANVTNIQGSLFGYCKSLISITVDTGNTTYKSIDGNVYTADGKILIQYAIGKQDNTFTIPNGVTNIGDDALRGASFKNVIIPNSVVSIGDGAFWECKNLAIATIPDSVKNMGVSVFMDCHSLETVILPEGIKSIPLQTFSNCNSLINVTIPKSVTEICDNAFARCSSIKEIILSDNIIEIGGGAFSGCASLKEIIIPEKVASIGISAFKDCISLTNITVAKENVNYESIDGNLYDQSLSTLIQYAVGKADTNFIIPESVTVLGPYAFYCGVNLKDVKIPNGVTELGTYAFVDCTSLESVTIPSSIVTIDKYAFNGCVALKSVMLNEGITNISGYAFTDCTSLESITIPSSIVTIDLYAFKGCVALKSVIFNEGITNISDYAFRDCTSLESIILPQSVTAIGSFAFGDSTALHSVYYAGSEEEWAEISISHVSKRVFDVVTKYYYSETEPMVEGNFWRYVDGVPTIWNAYVEPGEPEDIVYSEGLEFTLNTEETEYSVTGIGTCADTHLVIPPMYNELPVTSIDPYAFNYHTPIESVIIPDSVTKIGAYAFTSCHNMLTITIGKGVQTIENYAFLECHRLVEIINLSSVEIVANTGDCSYPGYYTKEVHTGPSKIVNNNGYLFYSTEDSNYFIGYIGTDTDIRLPEQFGDETYEILPYAMHGATNITSLVIPDNVTRIGYQAFDICLNLETLTIGKGVEYIEENAFNSCEKLITLIIPDSVSFIGNYAFCNCLNLKSIVISNGVKTISEGAFSDCTSLTGVYYTGTEEEWSAVSIIEEGNDPFTNATRYYYSETEPMVEGNFWRYVDGVPTPW